MASSGVLYDSSDSPDAVEVADINRDGRLDVVVLHGGTASFGVYYQKADGTLASEKLDLFTADSHHNPHGLALGDVNGDGSPDVVGAGANAGLVVIPNGAPRSTAGDTAPGAPTLTTFLAGTNLRLDWTPPADGGTSIVGYRIYRGTANGAATFLTTVDATARSYLDTSSRPGTSYRWWVAAVNAVGEGPMSAYALGERGGPLPTGCRLRALAVGGDAYLTVVLHPTGGSISNTVSLTLGDSNAANDSVTTVDAPPVMPLTGATLSYTSGRGGAPELYAWSSGAAPVNLTHDPFDDFAGDWSPDGTKLVFDAVVGGNDDLYVIDRDGTGLRRLTFSPAIDENPSWSPDGQHIVFDSERVAGYPLIFALDLAGGAARPLTTSGADVLPEYSPDGSKIAFVSGRDGNSEIYVMNADGSGVANLTNDPGLDYFAPSWSPDGSKIAFGSKRGGNFDVFTMNADGTGQTNVTNNAGDDIDPAWSPSGTQLAFASDRSGQDDIYVAAADGSGVTRLAGTGSGPNTEPAWLPAVSAPAAPTAVTAAPGDGQVAVSFTPGWDGGQVPQYFTVTASPGGMSGRGTGSPVVVGGLQNGQSYTFTVTATNSGGTSPPSAASAPVVPDGPERPHDDPPPAAPRPDVPEPPSVSATRVRPPRP